jgi:hypothetical protein
MAVGYAAMRRAGISSAPYKEKKMSREKEWYCVNCEAPCVLDGHGRCERCESDSVVPNHRRWAQCGYATLVAMLITLAILLTLSAMALPNVMKIISGQNQAAAKERLLLVWRANAATALCSMQQGCIVPVGVSALVPASGSAIPQQGYKFMYTSNADGTWLYRATPLQPGFSGTASYDIDGTGVLR